MKKLTLSHLKELAIASRIFEHPQYAIQVETLRFSIRTAIETMPAGEKNIRHHSVAGLEPDDTFSDLNDDTCRFMPHDERKLRRVTPSVADMEIRAADATRLCSDDHFIGPGFGGRDIIDAKGFAYLMENCGFHHLSFYGSFMAY
jgi:hypothetical protein